MLRDLQKWLRVRKIQWRLQRRKRQRRKEQEHAAIMNSEEATAGEETNSTDGGQVHNKSAETSTCISKTGGKTHLPRHHHHQASGVMVHIDALLEEQEQRVKKQKVTHTFDLLFVFDARLGAPDDVIAHCLRFLDCSEHGKLLCVSAKTSAVMKEREDLWRQMCPTHWVLPRRPRKRWHELYITRIRQEEETARKRSDDLLTKLAALLVKGDHIQKVEKFITQGEKKFGFKVNYVSGIVCERNSVLNLAVIHRRFKVARWLVEEKGADIESSDRGNFTPLLNAAWAGDRMLVRFLLGKGCDRAKVGTGHYTQALAPPDFEGLTAEGWARKRGHSEIADLIKLGL